MVLPSRSPPPHPAALYTILPPTETISTCPVATKDLRMSCNVSG